MPSPGGVSGLADDLSHLNLPAEVAVGSVVQCSIASRTFKGEVMAFDTNVKAIILSESYFLLFTTVSPFPTSVQIGTVHLYALL